MIRKVGRKIKRMVIAYLEPKQAELRHEQADEETEQLTRILKLGRYTQGKFKNDQFDLIFPDPDSFVFMYRELFTNEVYTFKTESDTPFIIDCGANIGLSVIFFKRLYPSSKILAFEPDKEIYSFLERNIHSNIDENDVELINKGVWNEDGSISFKNEGADAGRISFDNDATTFKKEVQIETVKLSKYIDKKVDFLKLDIEGAEVRVIEEIESKMHLIDNIFIEYHSFVNSKQELHIILDILSRNNFRYYLDSPLRLKQNSFIDNDSLFSIDFLLNISAVKQQ